MAKKIKITTLTTRMNSLNNYLIVKDSLIKYMTPATAEVIYKDLKDIILKGKFFERTVKLKNPPPQFEPVHNCITDEESYEEENCKTTT